MAEKKDLYKFTIQFNPGDPSHRQTADMLNRQGRRKAQFIVNAIQHYLHCDETPAISQPPPIDLHTIEDIVRRTIEKQTASSSYSRLGEKEVVSTAEKSIPLDSEAAESLRQKDLEAITNTVAMFRKGY